MNRPAGTLGHLLTTAYGRLDRRVLGVFRIYFGCVLIFDLARRWPHLVELYTDAGLLSREFLAAHPQVAHQWSLYFLAHSETQARIALAITALVYAAYTLGLFTHIAQWLVLVCIVGLDTRNLFVEHGGTIVMHLLATWTVLLPVGDRYSFDAWRQRDRQVAPNAFVSVAAFGIAVQIAAIYGLNAMHKLAPPWTSGEAIHYVLWQNRVATPLAGWLRLREPAWLSPLASFGTIAAEVLIAVLVLLPTGRTVARTAALALAVGLHLSIAALMRLGPFSWAMIALVLLVVPTEAVDALALRMGRGRRDGERPGGTTGIELSAKTLRWLRESGYVALFLVMLGSLLTDDPTLRRLGVRLPRALSAIASSLRLRQQWTMYASVPRVDGMMVVDAMTSSARHIDPFTGRPPDFEAPLRGPVPHSELMANYLVGLMTPMGSKYLPELERYLAGWQYERADGATEGVRSFDVWWVGHETPSPGSVTPCCRVKRLVMRREEGRI